MPISIERWNLSKNLRILRNLLRIVRLGRNIIRPLFNIWESRGLFISGYGSIQSMVWLRNSWWLLNTSMKLFVKLHLSTMLHNIIYFYFHLKETQYFLQKIPLTIITHIKIQEKYQCFYSITVCFKYANLIRILTLM